MQQLPREDAQNGGMSTESLTYPVGLRLANRRVVIVGAGRVTQRRIPALLDAGAYIEVIAPDATPTIEGFALNGQITWTKRAFDPADLDGAWYVIAATDSPQVNASVLDAAEQRRIFCVRCDDADSSSAITPATGTHAAITVAVMASVVGERDPRRSAALRDDIVTGLHDGSLQIRQRAGQTGVTLVGGGPGDADLITVAGRKALLSADVVVADRLAPQGLIGDLPAHVEVVDVAKLPRGRSAQQAEINELIVKHALEGKRVVRLKGGDNFVFGRGFEEIQACESAGVPVTVIPGISSPLAVPALAGIPVTHRGITHDFTVISGHLPPGHPDSLVNWQLVSRLPGTLVLMMAVDNIAAITAALLAGGQDPARPAAVVCDGSLSTQRRLISNLADLASEITRGDVRAPAIIVIGKVVGLLNGTTD